MIRPEEARRAHSKVPISHLRQSSRVSHSQCTGDFSNEDKGEGREGRAKQQLALLVRLEDKH